MSAKVGQPAPDFKINSYDRSKDGSDDQFAELSLKDFNGKWVCLFFYPLDFTFVCPTEIVSFNDKLGELDGDRPCGGTAVLCRNV